MNADEPKPFGQQPLSFKVEIKVPANLFTLYAAIKNLFKETDSQLVSDCLHFALLCHQRGWVRKGDNLRESLENQVAGFEFLRERIGHTQSNLHQATFVSSSVLSSLLLELARRPNLVPTATSQSVARPTTTSQNYRPPNG